MIIKDEERIMDLDIPMKKFSLGLKSKVSRMLPIMSGQGLRLVTGLFLIININLFIK